MGFWFSKTQKPPELRRTEKPKNLDPEEAALARIRKTLTQDLETFLLNNIMLSVQFFDNFEREMGILRVTSVAQQNRRLAEHQRHCLTTDHLYEAVARYVLFQTEHGARSHHFELLHTPRLYIIHDNVEVVERRDSVEYSSPCYRFSLENATKNRPGYMKLRAEESSIPHIRRTTYETIGEDEGVYTHISSDSPEEIDSNKTILEKLEDQENEGPSFLIKRLQFNEETDEPSEREEIPPILGPRLHIKTESGETSSTTSKKSRRLEFGPQRPELEDIKKQTFTPTERRLSGIIKTSKYNNINSIMQKKKNHKLITAQSLPNLALPTTNTNSVEKSLYSPKNSGDSSGYKSEGGSPNHNNVSPPRSHSSDSDYGYATITELTTPKPLRQHRLGYIPNDTSELPKECFNTKDVPVLDDDEDEDNYNKPRRSLFETRYYLNSIIFMKSFIDIFSEKLALPLGFDSGLESATLQGSKIYCDIVRNGKDSKPIKVRNEITPTLFSVIWPKEALKWKTRSRNRIPDPRPGAVHTWPTQSMLEQVQRLGCHFLPQGYLPTRGKNNEQYLEWQIAFPEAERYLETYLTYPQIRCLLFCMALYKSFIEPASPQLGLTPTHIRTLLFWQCERNFAAWPEDRPGETLRKFLEKLYDVIMQKNLPDYFIAKRNLFESTPRSHLLKAQEKLLRIRENPVMFLLIAARNLRYTGTTFYPVLDVKKLYQIITTDNLLVLVNPHLPVSATLKPTKKQSNEEVIDDELEESEAEEENSNIDLWKPMLEKDPHQRWKKKVRNQIEIERAAQKLTNPPPSKPRRLSTDSINIKLQPCKGAEPLRRKLLLEFFIPHFIEIAKQSNTFRATRQALFYLQHAERLTKLLQELEDSEPRNSIKYISEIRSVRDSMNRPPARSNTSERQPGAVSLESNCASKSVKSPTTQTGKFNFKDSNQVNTVHEKTDSSSNSAPQSILKKGPILKISQSPQHATSAQVHEQKSVPTSPEIKIQIPEDSIPKNAAVTVDEAVTAESTDF